MRSQFRGLISSHARWVSDCHTRSEKCSQRNRRTHSSGRTAWSVFTGSTCQRKLSELTFHIESGKFNSSPNLVSGVTFLERSTQPTSELEKFIRLNSAPANCGGVVQIFFTSLHRNGHREKSSPSRKIPR